MRSLAITERVSSVIHGVLDVVFPAVQSCLLCGKAVAVDMDLPACQTCISRMPPIGHLRCMHCGRAGRYQTHDSYRCIQCRRGRSFLEFSRCYGIYEGFLRECIHALKYRSDLGAASVLGALMGWIVATDGRFGKLDLIVPVPLHPKREAERGYNQAKELGLAAGAALNIPVVDVAERVKETSPQSGLRYDERLENVKGAFNIIFPDLVANRKVLIVDDVWTTGATVNTLAYMMLRSGTKRCVAVSAAAGSLEQDFVVS